MLKPLLKLRLEKFYSWFTGAARKNNKRRKPSKVRSALFALLTVYVLGCFGFLFYTWFDALALAWAGTELSWLYFALLAITCFALMFFFSIFTAKEQLFEAKDNDLLLSLPLAPSTILFSRMVELFAINLAVELVAAIPASLAYLHYQPLSALGGLAWLMTVLLLPLFSLAFSALFGWILTLISGRVRKKSLVSTVFSLLFLGLYFYFIAQANELASRLALNGAAAARSLSAARPLYWLGLAVTQGHVLYLLLDIAVLLLPFALAYWLLSRTFLSTVTAQRGEVKVEYKAGVMKASSPEKALLRRELSCFLASSSYIVNAGLGLVMLVIGAVALPFARSSINDVLEVVPYAEQMLLPGLLMTVCALSGMTTISASSVAIEGGSLWIAQSLPVSSRQVLRAKLLLHCLLSLIPVLLACLSVAWLTKAKGPALAACFLLPLTFAGLMAQLGLVANLRHPNLDWTNESQAVKNGASVIITLLLGWGILLVSGLLTFLLSRLLPIGWALLILSVLLLAACRLIYGWLMSRGAAIYSAL